MPDQPERPALAAEHAAFRDEIAAAALGGTLDPAAAAHLARCAECSAEIAANRKVTGLARAAVAAGGVHDMPPQHVWHRIAAAVGFEADPSAFSAVLEAAAGATSAHGLARVREHDTGRLLSVDATGLSRPEGYYAVWLADPDQRDLVAMGTLGPEHRGVWTVPPGLDLAEYPLVIVSAQRYGGVPSPGPAVLRGAFTR